MNAGVPLPDFQEALLISVIMRPPPVMRIRSSIASVEGGMDALDLGSESPRLVGVVNSGREARCLEGVLGLAASTMGTSSSIEGITLLFRGRRFLKN